MLLEAGYVDCVQSQEMDTNLLIKEEIKEESGSAVNRFQQH